MIKKKELSSLFEIKKKKIELETLEMKTYQDQK